MGAALDINITWFVTVFPGPSHSLFTFRGLLLHCLYRKHQRLITSYLTRFTTLAHVNPQF